MSEELPGFASWLRRSRHRYGRSRREVALELGVHVSTVGCWERGDCLPREAAVSRLLVLDGVWGDRFPESRLPPDMSDEQWAEWLRDFRVARGLSMDQLGSLVGRSGGTVSRWEAGMTPVPRATRVDLWQVHLNALGGDRGDR